MKAEHLVKGHKYRNRLTQKIVSFLAMADGFAMIRNPEDPTLSIGIEPEHLEHVQARYLTRPKLYDVEVSGRSDKVCGKILRALIDVQGQITCTYDYAPNYPKQLGNRRAFMMRVQLHEGTEQEFEEMTGLKLVDPPVVHLN